MKVALVQVDVRDLDQLGTVVVESDLLAEFVDDVVVVLNHAKSQRRPDQ